MVLLTPAWALKPRAPVEATPAVFFAGVFLAASAAAECEVKISVPNTVPYNLKKDATAIAAMRGLAWKGVRRGAQPHREL